MMTYLDWIDFVDEDKDEKDDESEPKLVVEGLERWTSGWGLQMKTISIDDVVGLDAKFGQRE